MAQAKELMLTDGKVPSIRKLASALNVDAMAIYHYFNNKEALLEAVTTSLMDNIYHPQHSEDWKHELECLCFSYLELLSTYSGLLETLLSMKSQGPAQLFTERFNTVISPLGLSTASAADALDLLVDYLHGFALAKRCNHSGEALTLDMIKGPLALYYTGLSTVYRSVESPESVAPASTLV